MLIDSSSLIFRAFYAIHDDDDENHMKVSLGVYKGWLRKFINKYNVTYVASAMDMNNHKSNNFSLDDNYKAGRTYPELLKTNFTKFHDAGKELGIYTFGIDGNEADDVIASTVHKVLGKLRIIVVSCDKDLLQLVDDDNNVMAVSLLNGGRMKEWHNAEVKEKFDVVHPSQVADWKALAGDSSDNYFGVNMIGPKSASNLLRKYKSVEGIYKALDSGLIAGKTATYLNDGRDDAKMCYSLAKLDSNLDTPITSIRQLLLSTESNAQ